MAFYPNETGIYTGTVEIVLGNGRVVWHGTVEGVAYERDVENMYSYNDTESFPITRKTTLVIEFAGDLVAWEE